MEVEIIKSKAKFLKILYNLYKFQLRISYKKNLYLTNLEPK